MTPYLIGSFQYFRKYSPNISDNLSVPNPPIEGAYFFKDQSEDFTLTISCNKRQHQCEIFQKGRNLIILIGQIEIDTIGLKSIDLLETVFDLYKIYGTDFVNYVKGGFLILIWDSSISSLIIANDRFGLIPFYYLRHDQVFYFGENIFDIKTNARIKSNPNNKSISEFLAFGYLLGNKTLENEIELLDPGCTVTLSPQSVQFANYYNFPFKARIPGKEINSIEIANEINLRIDKALTTMLPTNQKYIIPLSGGLDSRTILFHSLSQKIPLSTYTFGVNNSWDVILAHEISQILSLDHYEYTIDENYLIEKYPEIFYESNGMLKLFDSGVVAVRDNFSSLGSILVSGLSGDSIFGSFLDASLLKCPDTEFGKLLYRKMSLTSVDEAGLETLLGNKYQSIINETYNSFLVELNKLENGDRAFLIDIMNIKHRQRRWVFGVVGLINSRIPVVSPFFDYDIFEHAMTLPVNGRLSQFSYVEALVNAYPNMAWIPWERTGRPLVSTDIKSIYLPIPKRNFLDIVTWSRTTWRDMLEKSILSSSLLFDYGIKEDALRTILIEHMTGSNNHTELISILLTLALW